jgi:hypothetical protein
VNWDAMGAIGEIVGAIAVVATLFYLAVQIRISNRNYKIESARSVVSKFHDGNWDMARDPELRKITLIALTDYSQLSADDSSVFDLVMWRYIGNAADALNLYGQGLLDEESFRVVMQSFLVSVRSAPAWWEKASKTHVVPASLLAHVDANIKEESDVVWREQYANWAEIER